MILARDFPVAMTKRPVAFNQDLKAAKPAPFVDNEFLFQWLRANTYEILGRVDEAGHGTTRIQTDRLLSLPISIPPLPVQQRIAGILSAYDELVENSQRRIKILESMARALYREWFVHFRFPGHENHPRVASPLGEIPQRWEVKPLFELTKVSYGKNLPTKKLADDGAYPVYGAAKIIGRYTEYTRQGRTIICGCRGSVGEMQITEPQCYVTNNSFTFDPTHPDNFFWLFHTLKERGVRDVVGGAAQPQITLEGISSVELVTPPLPLRNRFQQTVAAMFEQAWALDNQIQNLRRSRDLLLPRLLSGQITLDVVEEVVRSQGAGLLPAAQVPPPPSTSSRTEVARPEASPEPREASRPISMIEREEVLCTIRKVFSDGAERDRDSALRDIAYALGYQRLGTRIREELSADFMAAVRRGIVMNEGGAYRLGFRSLVDCTRDTLKEAFESAIGRAWVTREDAIRAFARWAGFARVGEVIDQTARSLINGLIREGRVETDGSDLIRRT